MSLTVSQLMELPCLRRATVLAGRRSLDRIVTSVTVLEYSTPNDMQKKLFDSIDFWGSELIPIGFCNAADGVESKVTTGMPLHAQNLEPYAKTPFISGGVLADLLSNSTVG